MGAIINKSNIVQEQFSPTHVLASQKRTTFLFVDFASSCWSDSTPDLCCLFAKMSDIPILRDYAHFSLLVVLSHCHVNPILSRCAVTWSLRASTSSTISGRWVA